MSWTIQSLSALIAATIIFAIGWSVVLRDRTRPAFTAFSFLCFNIGFWQLTRFLDVTFHSEIWYLVSVFSAVLIPIASLRFFRAFLAGDARRPARLPRLLSTIAAGLIIAICYAIAFRKVELRRENLFRGALALHVYGGLGWSLAALWAAYRRTLSRVEKTRHLYLLVGGAAATVLTATDQLLPVFPEIGNILIVIYMYFIAQTLFRYRLLDLDELLGKMMVLAVFAVVIATIYVLLLFWIPAGERGLYFFNAVAASTLVLILYDPLRSLIEGKVSEWLFRERHELRRNIESMRRALANVIDVREAVRIVLSGFEESRRITHAAIYLVDQEGVGYELQPGFIGPRPVERVELATRRPLVERLTAIKGGAAISLGQLERESSGRDDTANETLDAIARSLDEMNAGVCVPVMADEQLLGLLCLKDERLREAFATDEIDRLRQLAAQLGTTLQNSKLYERMKDRDRLAALGEMAAGLAHEIRNPLGAIKGAAQLLVPPPSSTGEGGAAPIPAESREFLGIIVEEVNRLNNVVSQFLDYARPFRGELVPLDVNDVVRKTAPLVTAEPGIEIAVAIDESLPRVRGDAEQLRQVFLNLAINAVQAMHKGGKLTISTAVRKGPKKNAPPQWVEIRFRDTGPGIPPAEMKHLFIPFFTTKEKGTGLGLPISQRIIENHGGRIEVRSRMGTGTTFTVVLPVPDIKEAKEPKEREPAREREGEAAARAS